MQLYGQMKYYGIVVDEDKSEGKSYLKMSAEKGDIESIHLLCEILVKEGGKKNLQIAFYYLQKGAMKGDIKSLIFLKIIIEMIRNQDEDSNVNDNQDEDDKQNDNQDKDDKQIDNQDKDDKQNDNQDEGNKNENNDQDKDSISDNNQDDNNGHYIIKMPDYSQRFNRSPRHIKGSGIQKEELTEREHQFPTPLSQINR